MKEEESGRYLKLLGRWERGGPKDSWVNSNLRSISGDKPTVLHKPIALHKTYVLNNLMLFINLLSFTT